MDKMILAVVVIGKHQMISLNLHWTYTLVIAKIQVSPSVDDELHLDEEIHNTVRKIIRDFVDSWYSTVSTDSDFENEVQNAMISMAMELKIRARQVDRKVIYLEILENLIFFRVMLD